MDDVTTGASETPSDSGSPECTRSEETVVSPRPSTLDPLPSEWLSTDDCLDTEVESTLTGRNRPNQEILVPDWLITSHVI